VDLNNKILNNNMNFYNFQMVQIVHQLFVGLKTQF